MKCLLILFMIISTGTLRAQVSWEQTNGPFGGDVRSLTINIGGDIFAGISSGGVFRSIDNGDNWTEINTDLMNTFVFSLAINAGGDIFAGTSGGVFRPIDNGDNWTKINTSLMNADVFFLVINVGGDIFSGISSGVF